MSVLDFFGDFVFLEHRRNGQTELKPFLTIFGTRMRATTLEELTLARMVVLKLIKSGI